MRIAVVGPESSGKTTLCEDLMLHYHCGMVGEVSREYLEELDRHYEEHDLLEIARSIFELHGSAQHWVEMHEASVSLGEVPKGRKPSSIPTCSTSASGAKRSTAVCIRRSSR